MANDEERRPAKLTQADYAASAKALGGIVHNTLANEGTARVNSMLAREDSEGLDAAMIVLASSCRDLIVRHPPGGADLGAILIGHQFKEVLHKYGLAIVPEVATPLMHAAWKQGWFRGFSDRYSAVLHSAWEITPLESSRDRNAT